MTPYQAEELETIRRLAERGKAYNEKSGDHDLDLFNEIIAVVERIKNVTSVAASEQGDGADVWPPVDGQVRPDE